MAKGNHLIIKQLIEHIFLFLILFFFLFELPVISGTTTRRLAIAISLIYLLFRLKKKDYRNCINSSRIILFTIFLSVAALILCVNQINVIKNVNYVYLEFHYFLYIYLYILIFSIFCLTAFRDINHFSIVYIVILLIQSIIIFYSLLNDEFRMSLYEHYYAGDDRFEQTVAKGTRIIGIGLHSSMGSVILSTGTFLLVLQKLNNRIGNLLFIISFLTISFSTALIGRTGLLMVVISFCFYIIYEKNKIHKSINITLLILLTFGIVSYILTVLDPVVAEILSNWITNAFRSEYQNEVASYIFNQGSPPLGVETILGTGVIRGYTPSGSIVNSDSGYLKYYSGIGVVGSFFYYYSLCLLLRSPKISMLKKFEKRLVLLLILTAFIIEYKEPYFQKYILAWFILVVEVLMVKSSLVHKSVTTQITTIN